ENLLDYIRRGEMTLRKDMIDLFLETKDVLMDQVAAYRNQQEPSQEAYDRICAQLRALAEERHGGRPSTPDTAGAVAPPAGAEPTPAPAAAEPVVAAQPVASGEKAMKIQVSNLKESDMQALAAEMALMGEVLHEARQNDTVSFWLKTSTAEADILAVCCFIVNEEQVTVSYEAPPTAAGAAAPAAPAPQPVAPVAQEAPAAVQAPTPAPASVQKPAEKPEASAAKPATSPVAKSAAASMPTGGSSGSSTIRVGVEKVDQIINLVGELVITQAMLVQTASTLDPVLHDRLLNGIEQLDRNARDLQEAVMSIRMVPMDYAFSRF